jgi:hypothetical protein
MGKVSIEPQASPDEPPESGTKLGTDVVDVMGAQCCNAIGHFLSRESR